MDQMSHYYRAGGSHVSYKSIEYELSLLSLVEDLDRASNSYDVELLPAVWTS